MERLRSCCRRSLFLRLSTTFHVDIDRLVDAVHALSFALQAAVRVKDLLASPFQLSVKITEREMIREVKVEAFAGQASFAGRTRRLAELHRSGRPRNRRLPACWSGPCRLRRN